MDTTNYDVPLSEYWRIIRKRKWTFFYVFGVVFISTVLFTKLQKPVYKAVMELKIDRSAPTTLSSDEKNKDATDLETEIRLVTSLNILRKVVERMEVLPTDEIKKEQKIHALSLDYQNRIKAASIDDTSIIGVEIFADSPEKGILLAKALADVYIEENTSGRARHVDSVIKHIEQQMSEYKDALEDEDSKLLKFQQNERVFEVNPDIKDALDRLTVEQTFEFENEMLQIDQQIAELENAIEIKRQKGGFAFLSDSSIFDNFMFTGLKRRLLELEFERFLLLIDYTEKHPEVVEQDKVINELKTKIVDMIKRFSEKSFTVNDESDLSLLIKKLFLESRREVLFRTVNKQYADKGSLSFNQKEFLNLQRNIERLTTSFNNLQKSKEEAELTLARVSQNIITVVSPPSSSKKPVSPKENINYMIGSLIGLLLGIMMCFINESMDTTIGTISDIEQRFNLPVLGIIPMMNIDEMLDDEAQGAKEVKPNIQRFVTLNEPRSWVTESFKILRTNLIQEMEKSGGLKTVLFSSAEKQEGKSTVITNLAISMAQLGKRTLLIGSNMRRPSIYRRFGLKREPGLADVLLGKYSWQEVLSTPTDILAGGLDIDKLLAMPGIDNLRILTAGHRIDNISELLNSASLDKLYDDMKKYFDLILIDCPPTLAVPDAVTICGRVDGVVLIYKVGKTPRDVFRMAKSRIEHGNGRILGVILNQLKGQEQIGASAYHFRDYVEKKKSRSPWQRILRYLNIDI